MTEEEAEWVAGITEELQGMAGPMVVGMTPVMAYHVAGLVQLALRHPGVEKGAREAGEAFLAEVRVYFVWAPTISDVMRRSADPANDR